MFYKTLSLAAAISLGLLTTPTYCTNNNNNEEQATGPTTRFVTAEARKAGFTHDDQNHEGFPVARLPQGVQYTIGFMSLGLEDSSSSQVRGQWINTLALTCKTFANVVDCLPHLKVREGLTKEQFALLVQHKTNLRSLALSLCFPRDSLANLLSMRGHSSLEKLRLNLILAWNRSELFSEQNLLHILAQDYPKLRVLELLETTLLSSQSNQEPIQQPPLILGQVDGAKGLTDFDRNPMQLGCLEVLSVSYANLYQTSTSFGSTLIRACPNLRSLSAVNIPLTPERLQLIESFCPKLSRIDASMRDLRGGSFGLAIALVNLKKTLTDLQDMNLYGVFSDWTEQEQLDVVTAYPIISEVMLHNVSPDAVKRMVLNLTQLRALELYECNNLTLAQLLDIMQSATQLTSFSLAAFEGQVDAPEDYVTVTKCAGIQTLNFVSCSGLSDNAALVLVKCCPNLSVLKINDEFERVDADHQGITDEGMLRIVKEAATTLRTLVWHDSALTQEQILEIMSAAPGLMYMSVPKSDTVNDDFLQVLREKYPNLEVTFQNDDDW